MYNIAIDGPSSAGKSSVAKLIAENLKILHLDTGSMYRAMALKALNNNIDPLDENQVSSILNNTKIEVKYIDNSQHIFLDNVDVTSEIRHHNISKAASDISSLLLVRNKLVAIQQEIASKHSCVLDGRDISTVVIPKAKYKFYLNAQPAIRARRRTDELLAKGLVADFSKIYEDILSRDYNDMNRKHSPLKKTDDAIEIDCTQLTIQQVVEIMLSHIDEK